MKSKTTTITQIALFAALQCVVSPFSIALVVSPVPVSMATLMLYLSVYILGRKKSIISCGIYILIGLLGLPVFSGFTGGVGKVAGPTGGYLLGYFFLVYISGLFVEKWNRGIKKGKRDEISSLELLGYFMQVLGMVLGTGVCYLFGTIWLSCQADLKFMEAITVGVLPFIMGDFVKIVVALMVGSTIRKRLIQAGLLYIVS